jgi:hypothetical protein
VVAKNQGVLRQTEVKEIQNAGNGRLQLQSRPSNGQIPRRGMDGSGKTCCMIYNNEVLDMLNSR